MIPVGTLCYVVGSPYQGENGHVVTVTAHGPRSLEECAGCDMGPLCFCLWRRTVCQGESGDGQWCFPRWSDLRPIAGPSSDIDETRETELVA